MGGAQWWGSDEGKNVKPGGRDEGVVGAKVGETVASSRVGRGEKTYGESGGVCEGGATNLKSIRRDGIEVEPYVVVGQVETGVRTPGEVRANSHGGKPDRPDIPNPDANRGGHKEEEKGGLMRRTKAAAGDGLTDPLVRRARKAD